MGPHGLEEGTHDVLEEEEMRENGSCLIQTRPVWLSLSRKGKTVDAMPFTPLTGTNRQRESLTADGRHAHGQLGLVSETEWVEALLRQLAKGKVQARMSRQRRKDF